METALHRGYVHQPAGENGGKQKKPQDAVASLLTPGPRSAPLTCCRRQPPPSLTRVTAGAGSTLGLPRTATQGGVPSPDQASGPRSARVSAAPPLLSMTRSGGGARGGATAAARRVRAQRPGSPGPGRRSAELLGEPRGWKGRAGSRSPFALRGGRWERLQAPRTSSGSRHGLCQLSLLRQLRPYSRSRRRSY